MSRLTTTVGRHGWTIAFLALALGMSLYALAMRGFVAMWVEGFGEFQQIFRSMFGVVEAPQRCWVHLGGAHLPLAVYEYVGALYVYLYAPFVSLWYYGLVTDPYIYRVAGIIFYPIAGGLYYLVLSRFFTRALALLGAGLFLTAPPIATFAITDHSSGFFVYSLIFACFLLLKIYFDTGKLLSLVGASFFAGMMVLTRLEVLVWFAVPLAIYAAIALPGAIIARWRNLRRKALAASACIGAFCLGSAPYLLYISTCTEYNPFRFVQQRVFSRSVGGSSEPIAAKLLTRIEQFWSFLIVGTWEFFGLATPNYLFGLAWLAAFALVVLLVIRRRVIALPLIYCVVLVGVSILTTGTLREEHLALLFPAVIALFVQGMSLALERVDLDARALSAIIAVLIGSNLATLALDWQKWLQTPPTEQTMLNQSDPILLHSYLKEHHADDYVLYTNIGMYQFQLYLNAGREQGHDIIDWSGGERFVQAAKLALLKTDVRRVFVAVPMERDGAIGTFRRTAQLHTILTEAGVPFSTERIATARNPWLYDLIIVEPGVAPQPTTPVATAWQFESIGFNPDLTTPTRRVGWLVGKGFEPGDTVVVNGSTAVETVFSGPTALTFAIPQAALGDKASFNLEIVRPRTLQRSRKHLVDTAGAVPTIRLAPS